MHFPDLLLIALGLAMDALAVSIAVSILLGSANARQVFRIAFPFGLFQALMPVIGWLVGLSFAGLIERWDHWVAFAILVALGIKMILDSRKQDEETSTGGDPSRGMTMVGLSIAVSIDALAVGLSFAMLNIPVWFPAVVIGLVAMAAGLFGMLMGKRLGARLGHNAELLGGIVLIAIGIKIVIEHSLGG